MENRLEQVRAGSALQAILDVVFLLSLPLLIATMVFWICSFWRCDVITIEASHPCIFLVSSNGKMRLEFPTNWARASPSGRYRLDWRSIASASDPDRNDPRYLGFGIADEQFVPLPVVPHWFVTTLIAAAIV